MNESNNDNVTSFVEKGNYKLEKPCVMIHQNTARYRNIE